MHTLPEWGHGDSYLANHFKIMLTDGLRAKYVEQKKYIWSKVTRTIKGNCLAVHIPVYRGLNITLNMTSGNSIQYLRFYSTKSSNYH